MTRRINYGLWGDAAQLDLSDSYAMFDPDEHYEPIDAVVSSLERRTRLEKCGGPRSEGTALSHGEPVARHYAVTLGKPCRSGGWTPMGEVWIAIPVEENQ